MNAKQPDIAPCGRFRANAPMKTFLARLAKIDRPAHGNLLAPFKRPLKQGLLKRDGTITFRCLTRAGWKLPAPGVPPRMYQDLSDYEHALNRLHVEDFVPRGRERYHLTLLRHSLALGDEIIRQIKTIAPRRKVQVTLCFDENLRRGICVFSFHLLRSGQELWPKDLEVFKQPCMTMET